MLPFVLYLLTGCATAVQILSLVLFFVWGRPVSPLEVVALVGSVTLVVMALYSLSRPRRAARGALFASAGMFGYYGFAGYAAIKNIVLLGSQYPLQLFIPPCLLVLTLIYSLFATRSARTPEIPVRLRQRWMTLVLAVAVVGLSPFISVETPAPDDFFVPRKVITIPMTWKRGDSYHGPNFVRLETSCLNSANSHCFCGIHFKLTRSAEFADYIQSFEKRRIPVRYEVFYGRDGQAVSANLVSVGSWPRQRFHENEQGISIRSGAIKPGDPAFFSRNPQDCFLPLQKHP